MQMYVKLNSDTEDLFGAEGLSFKSVEKQFAEFTLDEKHEPKG